MAMSRYDLGFIENLKYDNEFKMRMLEIRGKKDSIEYEKLKKGDEVYALMLAGKLCDYEFSSRMKEIQRL